MKYSVRMTDRKTSGARKSRKSSRPKRIRVSARSSQRSRTTRKRSGSSRLSSLNPFWKNKDNNKRSPRSSKAKKDFKMIFKRFIAFLFGAGFLFTALLLIVGGIYMKSLQKSLPDPYELINRNNDKSTIIYDRNGVELYKIYADQNREFIEIDEIPEDVKWALLAAEDVDFYSHKGLDWKGIASCSVKSGAFYASGGSAGGVCGASTISQQLVRNTLMYEAFGDEAFERGDLFKTGRRKMREWLLTMQVEQTFTKDEILQMYINEIPMGSVNYGFQAASKSYFGKNLQDVSLAQASMLAGYVQAPSIFAPIYGVEREGIKDRQDYVLTQMVKHSNVTGTTQEQTDEAREEEIEYKALSEDIPAYHFVFYVRGLLEEEYGQEAVTRGGLKVTTTLDLSTQKIAEEEIRNGIEEYGHKWGVYNGAMVVIDPNTGQILAMVGSVDPNEVEDSRIDGSVNVTTSLRQVGSSFKPYTYLTAFQNYGPWVAAPDIKMDFGGYKLDNWDERYLGMMTARQGLVMSRNISAVYTLQHTGIGNVIQTAEKMGITTLTEPDTYGLSMTLGTAEMRLIEHAQAFTVFANEGVRNDSSAILKVENSSGDVLQEYEDTGERVFTEQDIYMMNWALCDLGNFGDQPLAGAPYYYYNIGGVRSTCGKTGTTNGPKDLVSIQYHKNLLVAVWAGNNNGEEVPGAWSTTVPLPIAHSFLERINSKYPAELYTRPSGIISGTVCKDTGRLASEGTNCPKEATIYVADRKPPDDKRETVHICTENNKIAKNYDKAKSFDDLIIDKIMINWTPENIFQDNTFRTYFTGLNQEKEEDQDGSSKTKYIYDDVESAHCTLPLGPNGAPIVTINSPKTGYSINTGQTLQLGVDVRAGSSIKNLEFFFDGDLKTSAKNKKSPFTVKYVIPNDLPSGKYNAKITATDADGKKASSTIVIKVKNTGVTIDISEPTTNSTVEVPVEIIANIDGFTPSSVTFIIQGTGNSEYTKSYTDLSGDDGWGISWGDNLAEPGSYTIQARAVDGSDIVTSTEIVVVIEELVSDE